MAESGHITEYRVFNANNNLMFFFVVSIFRVLTKKEVTSMIFENETLNLKLNILFRSERMMNLWFYRRSHK